MRGQRYTLCVEFENESIQLRHPNDRLNKLAEFCIVDSRLRLDAIKCTTGPIEHVELKSDGTMIWYKEEGGQSNALCVEVRLEDSSGNLITGQAVPFELQCLTRFMKRVENQDAILHIKKRKGQDTILTIDETTGKTMVVFRFDKVSSKNKGPFSLQVGPNLRRDATCARIYGSRSTPVEVKSKRSKESKRKLKEMKNSTSTTTTTTTTTSKKAKRRRKGGKMDKDALRVAVEHKAAVPTTNSAALLDTKIGTKAKRGMIRPSSSIVRKSASSGAEQIATRNLSMWVRETKCILSKLQFGLVGYVVFEREAREYFFSRSITHYITRIACITQKFTYITRSNTGTVLLRTEHSTPQEEY